MCSHLDALTYLRDAVREPQCGAKLQELVGRLTVVSQSMQPACGSCLAENLLSAEYQTGAELRSLNSGLLLLYPSADHRKPAEFARSLEPDWDRGPASSLLLLGATHLSAREWLPHELESRPLVKAHAAGRDNQAALNVDDGSPCASSGSTKRSGVAVRACQLGSQSWPANFTTPPVRSGARSARATCHRGAAHHTCTSQCP